MAMQAVPVVSWLTLIVFAWGIGWKGPLFIAVVALLPMAALTTVSGVHSLDRDLLDMARLYGVPRGRVLRHVYFGSLLPFVVAVLDVSVGQAWKVILVAEYLCGGSGLGVRILMARMNVDAPAT
jgi:NitT/TauT family transport system permease protein